MNTDVDDELNLTYSDDYHTETENDKGYESYRLPPVHLHYTIRELCEAFEKNPVKFDLARLSIRNKVFIEFVKTCKLNFGIDIFASS